MNDSQNNAVHPKDVHIGDLILKRIFLEHLNSIYTGKQHLINFFNEIKEIASLQQLKLAIQECTDDAENLMQQLDEIFEQIGEDQSKISVLGIKAVSLEAYLSAIKA